jgi:HSP20 family protein
MLLRAQRARYAVLISPRDDIDQLHSELEEVFNELWHGPRFTAPRRGFRPSIDVVRTEEPDELRVTVDLAGVDPGDVRIVVHERALLIAGQRQRLKPDCRLSYHLMEIEYGAFERRIGLPEHVDPDGARATYERGLLTVLLPVATAPPRHERILIHVRTAP